MLVTAVPSTTSEFLAFGMVEVSPYSWKVNFVARLGSGLQDFLSKMPSGTKVDYNPPTQMPTSLEQYMLASFPPPANLAA